MGTFYPPGSPLAIAAASVELRRPRVDSGSDVRQWLPLNAVYVISRRRTVEQDASFGIRQLVDIALKALSPGINDTTTALGCINYIAEILGRLANRKFPERVRSDNGRPLVIAKLLTFDEYLSAGFDQIMVSGKGHFAVFERLASSILYVSSRTNDGSRLAALSEKLDQVSDFAAESIESTFENETIKGEMEATSREAVIIRRHPFD